MAYEAYTGSFHLSKIEKEIKLLEKLSNLEEKESINSNATLKAIYDSIALSLESQSSDKEYLSELSPTTKKVLAALAPWLLLTIFIALGSATGLTGTIVAGMAFCALPFIIIAAFLPSYENSWINYIAYPIGHTVLAIILVMIWNKLKK